MRAADATRTPWLRTFRPLGAEAPTLVLFPHAGGSAGFYRGLADRFGSDVDVRAVQYPGREARAGEELVDDMEVLADRAAEALLPLAGRRLAILGHSMGALVAYEVTRRLEAEGVPVERLFASARHPPHLPGPGDDHPHGPDDDHRHSADDDHRLRHLLDDDAFAEMLRDTGGTPATLLDEPEMRDYLLPIVRNDYRLVETYEPSDGPALRTGVVSIAAEGDGTVTAAQVEGWRRTTAGSFEHLTFPGGHFYLLERPDALASAVLTRLGWDAAAR
ncbi:putative thioesterase [Actinacidiphila reveromycinica]|uniref:Putative thioesterase n=1 Tax=Actinacidiphila reveromycinica TaxID=659352 RepID=A0A7U3V0W2_9ACTN|nr:alpha/beta fold hydrolase [Streptomyces sp. SN-593]BBB02300.1 putative thioesterase [Streptomyces sp. SN-593]